jgi:hypothetical protein
VKFDVVIFLIIAFNVAITLWQRHAKKQKKAEQEALLREQDRQEGITRSSGSSASRPLQERANQKKTTDYFEDDSYDDDDDPHGEHSSSEGLETWHHDHDPGSDERERRQRDNRKKHPWEEARKRADHAGKKAAGAGQTLLDQLAKELGLKLPESLKPKSEAKTQPAPKPAPRAASATRPRAEKSVLSEKNPYSLPTKKKSQLISSYQEKSRNSHTQNPIANTLQLRDGLRHAILMKEILDKPVSLRRKERSGLPHR